MYTEIYYFADKNFQLDHYEYTLQLNVEYLKALQQKWKKDRISKREKEIKRQKQDGINSKMKNEQRQTEYLCYKTDFLFGKSRGPKVTLGILFWILNEQPVQVWEKK